jgi:hypothetical protein
VWVLPTNTPFFELDYPQKSPQCFAIKKPASNPTPEEAQLRTCGRSAPRCRTSMAALDHPGPAAASHVTNSLGPTSTAVTKEPDSHLSGRLQRSPAATSLPAAHSPRWSIGTGQQRYREFVSFTMSFLRCRRERAATSFCRDAATFGRIGYKCRKKNSLC